MSKRRAHRKSRVGCAECKRRHIKCDEEKPQCLHCVRHNISCIYRQTPTAASDVSSVENLSPQSDSSWQIIGQDDHVQGFPNTVSTVESTPKDLFEMSDMVLLHHWTTVGGRSILNTHELDHFWHSVVPSVGFKYQHVIHSVLSISALHIAHTRPLDRSNYLLIAAEHRSKALDGFTEDLHDVGPANCNALFANATLTFLYAFISFSKMFDEEHTDKKNRTTRILGGEWIPLVRGTAAVLQPIHEHIREGPLSSCLDLHNFADLDPTDDVHTSAYSDRLMLAQEIWAADEHAEVYNETLHMLLKCSAWMALFDRVQDSTETHRGYNRFCSGPFIWVFSVPEKYLVLQHQRQPPALIIFAFYGVLLHRLNGYWWAEGCGRSIVDAVDECLGPYWGSWMDWPKQAVGLH